MQWTERYRPRSLDDIRGNTDAIADLRQWAESWTDHQEPVILHGPPGIGKTTAAHAVAADYGWEPLEMNASEQRTQSIINNIAGEAAGTATLSGDRRVIILDEADSLHGTVDRGGTRAMTTVVKEAQQPVILIGNDFYDMSDGVKNNTQHIEFNHINTSTVVDLLGDICDDQNIPHTDRALHAIASKADGDIRAAVNDLQAAVTRVDGTLTEDAIATGDRDREQDIFNFLDVVLQDGSPKAARDAAYDVDETPDTLLQWIEENLVSEYSGAERAAGYAALATADQWLGRVQATQDYTYWRYATSQMTAGVALSRSGRHRGWTRWSVPSTWRKLGSTSSKRSRRDEIAHQIATSSDLSIPDVRAELLPHLRSMIHHCKPREQTVNIAAKHDLDADDIAYITGSGATTNKVSSIIDDAQAKQDKQAVAHIDLSTSSSDPGNNRTDNQQGLNQFMTADPEDTPDETTSNESETTSDDDEYTQSTLF